MKRFLAVIAGLLLLSLVWVIPTQAHALLVRSQPEANAELAQPPASIEMWFSEPLEATFTGARLLTSGGEEVNTGAPILDPTDATHLSLPLEQLEPGIYTVAWQTLSQVDGHEWVGSFPFTVLNPDGSRPADGITAVSTDGRGELPTPTQAAARWLTLAGGMLLFGAPLFRRIVAMPEQSGETVEPDADSPALRVLWLALLLLMAGDWSQLLLQMGRLGGIEQLPDLLLTTRIGLLALARQLLSGTALLIALTLPQPWPLRHRERRFFFAVAAYAAVVILLLLLGSRQDSGALLVLVFLAVAGALSLAGWASRSDAARVSRRTWDGIILAAAAALFTLSASSHAGAVAGSAWAVLGDYVHLLAAAAWLGGLLLLAFLFWQHWQAGAGGDAAQRLRLVRRFSFLASFSVFVLVFTGVFNSLVELPAVENLWGTAYGRVLLLKLELVALALSVAFFNNLVVHRAGEKWPAAERMRRLKRQIVVEASAALLLLLSVAVLVQTPAPRGTVEQRPFQPPLPFNTTTSANDLTIHTQVSPNQVGNNRFWLHLYRPASGDIGEVQLVRLLFNYQETALGQASADLEPLGQGAFAVEGAYLNQAGSWEISIYVRRRGMDDTLVTFALEVPQAGPSGGEKSPWQNPIPAVPPAATVGVVLAALGLIPALWWRPLHATNPKRFPSLKLGGNLLAAAGLLVLALVVLGVLPGIEMSDSDMVHSNPIEATQASIEHGRALYEQHCLQCHGPMGAGDGPIGFTLQPPPANLQVHMIPGVHSDGQIFEWISSGVPDTPMPAFGNTLSEAEQWHVINYIRTLAPEG